jgi:predicted metalloprotease with PDZ domain/cyclophilin family peptidyl-prolyl cis-trans isomerase
MPGFRRLVYALLAAACATATPFAPSPHAQRPLDPIVYTLRFPDPASKAFTVEMTVPSGPRATVDLMMAIWSPGFYGLQNYADRVSHVEARAADATALDVLKPSPSRWTVATGGRPSFTLTYTVAAPRGSNLGNGVTETSAVIIGPATYITLVEPDPHTHRPAEVRLDLPAGWKGSMTSLDAAPGGRPNDYVAPDYDILADSPILAGVDLATTEFAVAGITHYWTYLGRADWDGAKVADWLKPLIEEHVRFWGGLPYRKYAFLNIVTGGRGGSGVEHLNSVAITTGGAEPQTPEARFRQAAFLSHEYFHAMNVKRLRPVELGPFDYEHAPVTTGLWVGEGLTSYFGDLLAERSGLGTPTDYLALESRHIRDLQVNQPGRLSQTLEQASSQMFERLPADKRVDYYVKGPVVGLVLDAHIRHRTNGRKSMDDVMRLEYGRWSGARGYTAGEFNQTVSDAAGVDVSALLHTLIATTEEVDYSEMLDWFGLRFAAAEDPAKAWTLEVRPDATPAQTEHFAAFMAHAPPLPTQPRANAVVVFETGKGNIEIEVDAAHAPLTAANFLKYVDGGFYDGGTINRAVRPDNTVRHDVEIQVIQFQTARARQRDQFAPVPLERTRVTGLEHVDGAVSMARNGPDTATGSFSIVIGDQPEMDFGGKRNPDGQGFAVFGRVVKGMDVVKAIQASPTGTRGPYGPESLDPVIPIVKARRR